MEKHIDFYNYWRNHPCHKNLYKNGYESVSNKRCGCCSSKNMRNDWCHDCKKKHGCCGGNNIKTDRCHNCKQKRGCCGSRNIKMDRCHDCKQKQGCCDDKKLKSDCSGHINTNAVLVDIFPNCTCEGSRIIINVFDTFVATTMNPPTCFMDCQGTFLLTGGSGVLGVNGVLYEGAYTLILHESTNAFDRFALVFVGRNAAGSEITVFIFGTVSDEQLSIRNCKKGCFNSTIEDESLKLMFDNLMNSVPFPAMDSNALLNNNKITTVVILPNGEVQTNEINN